MRHNVLNKIFTKHDWYELVKKNILFYVGGGIHTQGATLNVNMTLGKETPTLLSLTSSRGKRFCSQGNNKTVTHGNELYCITMYQTRQLQRIYTHKLC